MPHPTCQQLRQELEEIKRLKKEFELELQKAKKTSDLTTAKGLATELEQRQNNLREILLAKVEIKAVWENPETQEKKEIILNINKEREYFERLYKENLNITIDKREFRRIWDKNRKEIKKEMETYGYDALLLIPENLPGLTELNQKLIETIVDPVKGEVEKTDFRGGFRAGEELKDVKSVEKPKNRLVLTKNVQNIYQSRDPIIEATVEKNVMGLSGLTEEEVKERIKDQKSLPINFKTKIRDKEITIQAEGFSLEEYIIFQRQYFDKYQKHLDESGWTWLLKSISGVYLTESSWGSGSHRLLVCCSVFNYFNGGLGCRLSHSFST